MNLDAAIRTIKADIRAKQQQAKFEQFQKMEELKNSPTFTISISRMKNSREVAVGLEEFQMEGYKNAKMIFDAYKSDGHLLMIHRLRMTANGEIVESVKFNYR